MRNLRHNTSKIEVTFSEHAHFLWQHVEVIMDHLTFTTEKKQAFQLKGYIIILIIQLILKKKKTDILQNLTT